MPTWSNLLPPQEKHCGYELRRTPANQSIVACITSETLLCTDTHYWHGRTMPCERLTNPQGKTTDDTTCDACRNKQPYRSHVYVAAFSKKTHEHFIFECTAQAAKPLQEYQEANGTIRGCLIVACRPKGTANSKVIITTTTADLRGVQLPKAPNIPAALAVIWRLPRTAIDTALEKSNTIADNNGYATRQQTIRTDPDILHAIRNQDDNAAPPIDIEARRREIIEALKTQPKPNGKKRRTPTPQCTTNTESA